MVKTQVKNEKIDNPTELIIRLIYNPMTDCKFRKTRIGNENEKVGYPGDKIYIVTKPNFYNHVS